MPILWCDAQGGNDAILVCRRLRSLDVYGDLLATGAWLAPLLFEIHEAVSVLL